MVNGLFKPVGQGGGHPSFSGFLVSNQSWKERTGRREQDRREGSQWRATFRRGPEKNLYTLMFYGSQYTVSP